MTKTGTLNTLKAALIVGIVALLLVGVRGLAAEPNSASNGNIRTISMSGQATVQASPDQATISFGVETEGATSTEALQRNSEVMNKVINTLKQAGIAERDIKTEHLAVYPNYRHVQPDSPNGKPEIAGYIATNQVSVRTGKLDQVSALIDAAVNAGANRVHGISFSLSDAETVYQQALKEALNVARKRAESLSGAANAKLGKIVSIDASGGTAPVPVRSALQAAEVAADLAPVEPGQIETRADITVVWELIN